MKNASMFSWMFAICLLGFGCDEKASLTKTIDDSQNVGNKRGYGPLISPLFPSYQQWGYHLMQGFVEHPVYEMVEVMVDEPWDNHPRVWFFTTERNPPKHQKHYVNDESLYQMLFHDEANDDVTLTTIDFSISETDDGVLSFNVGLEDELGTPISWHFESTGAPTNQYADFLVDQSGHDLEGGILVMFVPVSATANSSTVFDDGENTYPIEVWETYSSTHYTTYHGTVTQGLMLGYLPVTSVSVQQFTVPKELTEDATWHQVGPQGETSWEVISLKNDTLIVTDRHMQMTLMVQEKRLEIESIRHETEDGYLSISFDPPLPDFWHLSDGEYHDGRFSIDIDDKQAVISGRTEVRKKGDTVKLILGPQTPEWAVNNEMRVVIQYFEQGYTLDITTAQL